MRTLLLGCFIAHSASPSTHMRDTCWIMSYQARGGGYYQKRETWLLPGSGLIGAQRACETLAVRAPICTWIGLLIIPLEPSGV